MDNWSRLEVVQHSPFVGFLPAIHGLFNGAFESHGSCIEVAVSAEKHPHRPRRSQPRSELDQIPDRLDRRGGRERLLQRPDAGDVGVFGRRRLFGVTLVSQRRRASRTVSCSTRISSPPWRVQNRDRWTAPTSRSRGAPSSSSRCAHWATSAARPRGPRQARRRVRRPSPRAPSCSVAVIVSAAPRGESPPPPRAPRTGTPSGPTARSASRSGRRPWHVPLSVTEPTMVRAVCARADREPRCADSGSRSDRPWERTPLT
jgi:hypothetical protein